MRGQLLDARPEATTTSHTVLGRPDAIVAPAVEHDLDLGGSQVAEELVGELAVRLREEPLGRRGEVVHPSVP
jgi:hypothetical protein